MATPCHTIVSAVASCNPRDAGILGNFFRHGPMTSQLSALQLDGNICDYLVDLGHFLGQESHDLSIKMACCSYMSY